MDRDALGTLGTLFGIMVILYFFLWIGDGCTAWGTNNGVKCEIGYDPLTHTCIDTFQGFKSNCSGWSPPGFCWRRNDVNDQKRNQHGMSEHEKAETNQMEAAGFVWDPSHQGYPRWTHAKVETTALRQPWMRDPDWDKHRADKITEAARLRRFEELPLGARFRMTTRVATDRRVFIKLGRNTFVPWESLNTQQVRTDVHQTHFKIVELFEPFHDLQPSELEELPKLPGVWQALADWHACQSAEAESQDWIEPMQWHDVREKACKNRAAELLKRWEDS